MKQSFDFMTSESLFNRWFLDVTETQDVIGDNYLFFGDFGESGY